MSDNKRYYYLKLKDNFFDSDAMIILENMQDGYMYSNILLKLYLRSLKNDGRLIYSEKIPYNSNILAQITRHSVGVIEKSLKIFKELDLVEILDNGVIYMTDIQNYIGESSTEADRKRAYRLKIENDANKLLETKGDKCPDKCTDKNPPEIEIELELELKKEKYIEPKTKKTREKAPRTPKITFGGYKKVKLTQEQYNQLQKDFGNVDELIKFLDEAIQMKGYKYKDCNLAIRKWVVDAVKEDKDKKTKPTIDLKNKIPQHNFEQREYDASVYDQFLSNKKD